MDALKYLIVCAGLVFCACSQREQSVNVGGTENPTSESNLQKSAQYEESKKIANASHQSKNKTDTLNSNYSEDSTDSTNIELQSYVISTEIKGTGGVSPNQQSVLSVNTASFSIDLPSYTDVSVSGCSGQLSDGQFLLENVTDNCTVKLTFNNLYKPSKPFNDQALVSNVTGALQGHVKFAQNHMVTPGSDNGGMHLVALRPTLLLFKPELPVNESQPISVKIYSGTDLQGELHLRRPHQLTKPYIINELALDVDFTIDQKNAHTINNYSKDAIEAALMEKPIIKLTLKDGFWTPDIALPTSDNYEDKIVILESQAGYPFTANFSEKSHRLVRGQTVIFKMKDGLWYSDREQENTINNKPITYGNGFWSGKIPAQWLSKNLRLEFTHNDQKGELLDVKVGAPAQLIIHTIDIGMLVEPRNQYHFQQQKALQREYFQTIPVSQFIVTTYAPVHLTQVRLPDGQLLTAFDPSTGGWHSGQMRQRIGKELFSIGINNANYGIHSSIGTGEGDNPYYATLITAHNSRGRYENGVVVHGGSGGAGMVTLDNTIGNEFSHEVGHNFGLGHYEGGFEGSVHKSAKISNSTWGWDADKNLFIPNFYEIASNSETCLDDQCEPPFHGKPFATDSMAGGNPTTNTHYTLYTPYSMNKIQQFFESKITFDPISSTGFWRWNTAEQKKEEAELRSELPKTVLGQNNSTENHIQEALNNFSIVHVHYANGNWQGNVHIPSASANKEKIIVLSTSASWDTTAHINNVTFSIERNKTHIYYSNGTQWIEDEDIEMTKPVQLDASGVPVITLIGYYDPENSLASTIYPPLYGNFGFTYQSDESSDPGCQIKVMLKDNRIKWYSLLPLRKEPSQMNKFHVNIAQSDQPTSAEVSCNGQRLDYLDIPSPPALPEVNVLGMPWGEAS